MITVLHRSDLATHRSKLEMRVAAHLASLLLSTPIPLKSVVYSTEPILGLACPAHGWRWMIRVPDLDVVSQAQGTELFPVDTHCCCYALLHGTPTVTTA